MNELIVLSLVCLTLAWATSSSENKDPSTNGENSDYDPNLLTRNRRWSSDSQIKLSDMLMELVDDWGNLRQDSTRPSKPPSSPSPRPSSSTSTDGLIKLNDLLTELVDDWGNLRKDSTRPSSPPPGHLPSSNIYSNEQQNDFTNDIKDECPCGEFHRREGRIIGGWETNNHYKSLVGFASIMEGEYSQVFGMGVMITTKTAMSATHNFLDKLPKDIVADIGGHDQSEITDDEELIQVIEIILHPEYDDTSLINDIALVTLEHEIDLTKAGLMCLYRSNQDLTGQHLKIIGWGVWNLDGDSPDLLQEGEVEAISFDTCRRMNVRILDNKKQFCVSTNNQTTYQGDSGGPLVWEHPTTKRLYAVGVVSFGVRLNTTLLNKHIPTVNTYVQPFIPWMEETIKARYPNTNMCALRRPMLVY